MKLITTFPLGHYEFSAFGPRTPPEASAARQSYYDQAEPNSWRRPTALKRLDPEHAQTYICVAMQQTVFQILADPTRLRIVEALAGGEQAVGELVRAVDIDQSGVSRHLRILGEAGFVTMRPDGARRLYSLRPEPFRALDDWVGSYRKLWESRLDRFDAALARRRSLRDRGEKT
jgi:DNA-binding transcriptional ArsR family regulator